MTTAKTTYEVNHIRDCGQGYSLAAYRDEADDLAHAGRTISEISETLSVAPDVLRQLFARGNNRD